MNDLATLLAPPYAENVYSSTYTDGRPCHVAEIPDLPGCVAYGDTADEASASLSQARRAYITHHHERGLPVPPPRPQPPHR